MRVSGFSIAVVIWVRSIKRNDYEMWFGMAR